jgi:hypothetical protein
MADNGSTKKDKIGYVVAAVTIVVSVTSLYLASVQAQLAAKSFELSLCSSNANLDKQLAELTKSLADRQNDPALAECLNRLSHFQNEVADRQEKFGLSIDRDLAGLQKHFAEVEQEVARLQQDREAKAHEAETLRARITELEHAATVASSAPAPTHHILFGSPSAAELLRQKLRPHPKAEPPAPLAAPDPLRHEWKGPEFAPSAKPMMPTPEPDRSLWAQATGLFGDLWEVIKKHVAVSIYFGIALLFILGKLFGR